MAEVAVMYQFYGWKHKKTGTLTNHLGTTFWHVKNLRHVSLWVVDEDAEICAVGGLETKAYDNYINIDNIT